MNSCVFDEIVIALMIVSLSACGLVIGLLAVESGSYVGGGLFIWCLTNVVLATVKNAVAKIRMSVQRS
ncbi:hypothetical protein [Vibrio fluvialis]|uniref:hypothetical protein n=1 Tax=Vibrio fluvialis TaxID=676 RepID=UPI001C9D7530|nr:hypothetical protein [Vibrio fluvialis]MBY7902369.1 hypothetical protein [Vibrio fluvialis]MDE5179213.1 hypothetical protein [Vibrio fluvialis]